MGVKSIISLLVFYILCIDILAAKTLNVAIPNEIQKINPLNYSTIQEASLLPLIYDPLLTMSLEGQIETNIMKKWKFNKKTKVFSFSIRKNLFFSTGERLTLQDIFNSFVLMCSKSNRAKKIAMIRGCFPYNPHHFGVKIVNDEVTVLIDYDLSLFIHRLSDHSILIIKKEKDHYVGTGPLKVDYPLSTRKNLILAANRKNKMAAKFDTITKLKFVYIPDHSIRRALKKGDIDIALMYLTSTTFDLKFKNYQMIHHAPHVTQGLILNPKIFPFNSKSLRRAIQKDISTSTIEKCSPGSTKSVGFIPRGIGGSFTHKKMAMMEKQKEVFPLKKKLRINIYRHIGRKNPCEEKVIQNILKKYHIYAKVIYSPDYKHFYKMIFSPKTVGFIQLYAFSSRDSSGHLLGMIPGKKRNTYMFDHPKIKNILDRAWHADGIEKRFSKYREINSLIFKGANILDLYYIGHSHIIRDCFIDRDQEFQLYNINSFLYLLQLNFIKKCEVQNEF